MIKYKIENFMNNGNRRFLVVEKIKNLLIILGIFILMMLAGLTDVSFGQAAIPENNAGLTPPNTTVLIFFIMLIIGNAAALLSMFYYFRKAESARLKELTQIIDQISEGKIHQTALEKKDRFNELSCAINDMSTNMQEVLIFLWKQNTHAMNALKLVASEMQKADINGRNVDTELIRHCNEVRLNNKEICLLLREFHLFGVNLNDEGVLEHEL